MILRDSIVSERFRGKVLRTLPILKDHPNQREREEWFRFFDLICFGCFDSESERPKKVIPHETILEAIGRDPATPSSEFKSSDFIARFTEKVLPRFLVSAHDHRSGKAREILDDGLQALRTDIDLELRSFHAAPDAKRVHLVTGERWTPPKARKLRERDRAIAASDVPKVDAAKRIVAYLNALNSNLFAARVGANMESAVEVAAAIDDKRRRGIELTKLHRIAAQPQPFYGPPKDAHTVRVFAKNTSILSLKNEVKAALIHGWRTFDLKSAQVAIVAKDWGMTKLHAWLSTPGNDIWKYLCGQHSGIDPTLLKPVLKKSVYSACYGMDKDTLIAELRGELIGLGEASQSALLSATMFANEAAFVAPLFEHREVMRERIKQDRGATDCFGQRIATSREVRPHAILSMLAQAREMQLLLPAIDLAVERKREFKIVLWEHDGFSVHFTKADRVDRESKRIIDAVNAECNRLGYPTRLERKDHQPVSPPTR